MFDAPTHERIGSALRALAADLVAERRQNIALRRENEQLKAQLEAAKQQHAGGDVQSPGSFPPALAG